MILPCAAASAASGFAGARDVLDSLAQRMQRALMTWQHPSAGMPAAAVAAVASSKQGVEFLEQRRGHWREAFRSLYMAVHSSACHAFYYMSPQVSSAKMQHCIAASFGPLLLSASLATHDCSATCRSLEIPASR